jgi:hypothetical protein
MVSAYHPCRTEDNHERFLDIVDTLLSKLPPSEIIMGADTNANVGHALQEEDDPFAPTLGPHGLSKRNSKGKNLLAVYMSHGLRIMNRYYPAKQDVSRGTWTSTLNREQSMLDAIVCSKTLHKRINNCWVILDDIGSNHRAIRLDLVLTSIKFKETQSLYGGNINWRKILTNDDCCKPYNDAALEATTIDMNYEEFNDAIHQSGMNTAISLKERCEGWYEFSQTELMPIIEEKNRLVHTLQQKVLSVETADLLQGSLKCVTKQVKDKVLLAKLCWYSNICSHIHEQVNPRLAWEYIHILTGGETAHHKKLVNMAM